MNNQKPESKSSESEEGDYAQPINLVASRPPAPAVVTTFPNISAPTANQQVSLRPHGDPPRPGLMLYFRAPTTTRSSGTGHIMSPLMGAQVASAQPFGNKSTVKTIKSMRVGYYQDKLTDKSGEYNIKVIRVPPNDNLQSQGSSTPTATLSPGILPSALAGNASRHIVPTAVHPGITTGTSATGSMASIIKAGHQVSQVGHAINQSFSSHVPRGPAAVASISAGPRSGVATPIVRAPHSSGTMTLASSMISPSNIRVRSQTMMAGRTSASTGYAQVIDLQKNSVGHSLSTTQNQIGSVSRSLDINSPIRSSLSHPSAITIAKPIVQHLQQVSEKGCLKAISSANAPSNSTPAHQSTSSSEVHSVCIVPTITRATVSSSGAYTAGIVQFPTAAIQQHVPALRPSLVQQQAMNISPVQGSQAFTVISAKSLPTTNQAVTLAPPPNRTAISAATIVPSCGSAISSMSTLTTTASRVLCTPSAVGQTAIPIAKVYPQNLPAVSQISSLMESSRSLPFVSQANLSTLKSAAVAATTTAISSNIHVPAVTKRNETPTSVRFAPLTKQPTSFAIPSTSYLYDQQQCPGTLSVHPYSVSSANQGFSSQLQTFAFGATKRITDLVTHAQTAMTTTHSLSSSTANLVALSQASTTHGTNHTQSNLPNHLSPRPSILRKRTNAEVVNTVAKRNLMTTLSGTEPGSPNSELTMNLSTSISPKPLNGPLRENGMATSNDSDVSHLLLSAPPTVIKKEPGVFNDEMPYINSEDIGKDARPIEASPRKKPRKQQLAANELIETHSSDNEENFETKVPVKDIKIEEDNNIQWVTFRKKPAMSLLTNYRFGYKARNNHFVRYGDVRPKDEKQLSVNELASSKGISEEVHGWKVHHLTGQMEDLSTYEDMVCSRLSHWLGLEDKSVASSLNIPSSAEDARIIGKLTDLVKGNLQRSKLSQEQAMESQQQVVKILDHKSNVVDIFSKYASRRQSKKKDKT